MRTRSAMSIPSQINVISVDVGTTSVRLAIIAFHGQDLKQAKVLAYHDKSISHFQDGDRYEQNSREIFSAICECSKASIQKSGIDSASITGIGFSATCSLVIENFENHANDVIMWMDHRAVAEAQSITCSDSTVLRQFGGVCSPEFSLAKLVWLRNEAPERLQDADGLFELPDWLVYRCVGGKPEKCPRSLCSLTCKWGFDAETNQHCDILKTSFDVKIFEKFGSTFLQPGTVAGFLSEQAASELGLFSCEFAKSESTTNGSGRTNIVVGTSLIDAHAGMLAMLSIPMNQYGGSDSIENIFCSLAGTSSCHMLLSRERNFTKGIWGPYKNVILDNFFLLEAGQSLTGRLIELCIENCPEGRKLLDSDLSIKQIIKDLNEQIEKIEPKSALHVLPTYHGNRSPLANPRLRGGVYGISTRDSRLLDIYIAHVEAIVFEMRLIVETLGIRPDCVLVSGGLMKNKFFMRTLANVLQCRAVKVTLQDVDLMLMGSALVARCAFINFLRSHKSNPKAQSPLTEDGIKDILFEQLAVVTYKPSKEMEGYLMQKYQCYKEFVKFSQRIDDISQQANS